jgi:hypothetical protein
MTVLKGRRTRCLFVQNWIGSPDTSTPLSAVAMEDLETRLSDYTACTGPAGSSPAARASSRRPNPVRMSRSGCWGSPDQVTGVVLPTDGLIAVWFQAKWQTSVTIASSAAVFIGANQLNREERQRAAGRASGHSAVNDGDVLRAGVMPGRLGDGRVHTGVHGRCHDRASRDR